MSGSSPRLAPRPVFAIFEGGGAKGIAHLGAVETALDEGLEFIGVAGASAGAFVAALLAAGFRGKDLFNPDTKGSDLLTRYGLEPTDLLGTEAWARYLAARADLENLSWRRPRVAWRSFKLARRVWTDKGYFTTGGVRDFVNRALRDRLVEMYAEEGCGESEIPARVRFRDLDYQRFRRLRPLKIVATNVHNGTSQLFSLDDTPDAEVAEAVAASIAIPGAFQPVNMTSFPGGLYADGGLTNNLPVGVFREEKLAYERRFPREPRVPILAFTLNDPPAPAATGGTPGNSAGTTFGYISAVVRTGFFGSQETSRGLMSDLITVALYTKLTVMEFDATWTAIRQAFEDGRISALREFRRSPRLRPGRVRAEMQRIEAGVRASIDAARTAAGRPALGLLRTAIVEPFGAKSLRVAYSLGMEHDADDNLLLDRDGIGVAEAFRDRTLILFALQRDAKGNPAGPLMMTKYEQAMVWRSLRSGVAIPIYDDEAQFDIDPAGRAVPPGVLVFDSDEDLARDVAIDTVQTAIYQAAVTAAALVTVREY